MTCNSCGLAREEVIDMLCYGTWVLSDLVCDAFSIPFDVAVKLFDFARFADWWEIVGKTDEERSRNGQRITCYFRPCKFAGKPNSYYPPREV